MAQSIYDAVGGGEALLALAHAWHARCLEDPVVSHAFSHPGQHPEHTERLAAYWAEALGGPTQFSDSMGDHSHVLRLHSGNGEHDEMDERAQRCFTQALDDAGLPDQAALRQTLKQYFRWATTGMAAYPDSPDDVPDGFQVPRWSRDGPTGERRLISQGSPFEEQIGYSRAVVDGDWVFVSGTTGFDYAAMKISDDVVEQADQALRNIAWALEQAGASYADVVRVRYLLPRREDFPDCWPVIRRHLGSARPAATMQVCELQDPRMRIEIEVTARRR